MLEIFESLATGDRSTHFPCCCLLGRGRKTWRFLSELPLKLMLSNECCSVTLHCHITKTSRCVFFLLRMVGSSNAATEPGQEQRCSYASEVTFGSYQICSLPVLNGSLNWERETCTFLLLKLNITVRPNPPWRNSRKLSNPCFGIVWTENK